MRIPAARRQLDMLSRTERALTRKLSHPASRLHPSHSEPLASTWPRGIAASLPSRGPSLSASTRLPESLTGWLPFPSCPRPPSTAMPSSPSLTDGDERNRVAMSRDCNLVTAPWLRDESMRQARGQLRSPASFHQPHDGRPKSAPSRNLSRPKFDAIPVDVWRRPSWRLELFSSPTRSSGDSAFRRSSVGKKSAAASNRKGLGMYSDDRWRQAFAEANRDAKMDGKREPTASLHWAPEATRLESRRNHLLNQSHLWTGIY